MVEVTSPNAGCQHTRIISSSYREWDRLTASSSVVYIGFNGIKGWKNSHEELWAWDLDYVYTSVEFPAESAVQFNLHFLQHIAKCVCGGRVFADGDPEGFLNTRHWDA